jgi:glycosyltransferase involved in cell wall biosynthesis
MSTKQLGLVIPTHNRCAALLESLSHLEKQTFKDFEVVIVDDGSTDGTPEEMESYQARTPLSIRYVHQNNSGPAKARNRGISMLTAPVCLLLGDDVFASPTLVEQHKQLHQENPDINIAGLGLIRWSTFGQKVTPFMRWLDEANVQFSYPKLLAGAKPDWGNFYSSNLSVKTELLRQFTFNEEFPYAAMEDAELGYRITKRIGLEIKFLPEAVADHLHPTTFLQACRRMVRVGYSFGLFYDLWPEQRPLHPGGRRHALIQAAARSPRLLEFLTGTVDVISKAVCPNPFMEFVLYSHFEVGLESRLKKQAGQAPASS